jgi:hypothetical protein
LIAHQPFASRNEIPAGSKPRSPASPGENEMKRIVQSVAVVVAVAVVASLILPKRSHGVVAAAVDVVNSLVPVNTESAKTPFQATLNSGDSLTVPTGQRLVIEFASVKCTQQGVNIGTSTPVSPTFYVDATWNGQPAQNILSPVYQGTYSFTVLNPIIGTESTTTYFNYTLNEPAKIYADPGSTVDYQVLPAVGLNLSTCSVVLTGYLINP